MKPIAPNPKPDLRRPHYTIVRRVPQLTGDAEWAVIEDGSGKPAEAVALFFSPAKAQEYVSMLEMKP